VGEGGVRGKRWDFFLLPFITGFYFFSSPLQGEAGWGRKTGKKTSPFPSLVRRGEKEKRRILGKEGSFFLLPSKGILFFSSPLQGEAGWGRKNRRKKPPPLAAILW